MANATSRLVEPVDDAPLTARERVLISAIVSAIAKQLRAPPADTPADSNENAPDKRTLAGRCIEKDVTR
jgi:hypothetical protein